jgi:alanine dehydrogenase
VRPLSIGVPKESKTGEFRVALTPDSVARLTAAGASVMVERRAGAAAGFPDDQYVRAGATIVPQQDVWEADVIVKVKEPSLQELAYIQSSQWLLCFLHLAANAELALAMMEKAISAIAYETVEDEHQRRPLLSPMSEIAGRLAPQIGAHLLERSSGGPGILLSGTDAVPPTRVVVLGGGTVGTNAARIAAGMGAEVFVVEAVPERVRAARDLLRGLARVVQVGSVDLFDLLRRAYLVIGAVYLTGAKAPKVITRQHLATMPEGSVLVDVSIDQGGCAETSRPTTHHLPAYVENGVIHYCVTNIPSLVSRTASIALSSALEPFLLTIVKVGGVDNALEAQGALSRGLNLFRGRIVHEAVRQALACELRQLETGGRDGGYHP